MGKTTQELINGRCPYYPSIGTNYVIISEDPLKVKRQGFNLNIGPSIGIPFGVEIPEDLPDELLKNALRVIKK
jgi:hypothetical protein